MDTSIKVYTSTQVVTQRDVKLSKGEVLDDLEQRMVAELARRLHKDGRQWIAWPVVERKKFSKPFEGTELRIVVETFVP